LPKLITDDRDLLFCTAAEICIFRNEQAAEKRGRAKFGISVSGSGKYAALRRTPFTSMLDKPPVLHANNPVKTRWPRSTSRNIG
jgi:hypothetical protein